MGPNRHANIDKMIIAFAIRVYEHIIPWGFRDTIYFYYYLFQLTSLYGFNCYFSLEVPLEIG